MGLNLGRPTLNFFLARIMFVVCDFREYRYACGFHCIEYSM